VANTIVGFLLINYDDPTQRSPKTPNIMINFFFFFKFLDGICLNFFMLNISFWLSFAFM